MSLDYPCTVDSKPFKKVVREPATIWELNNPVISAGTCAIDTTHGTYREGDGETPFLDLPAQPLPVDEGGTPAVSGNVDMSKYLSKTDAENTYAKKEDIPAHLTASSATDSSATNTVATSAAVKAVMDEVTALKARVTALEGAASN